MNRASKLSNPAERASYHLNHLGTTSPMFLTIGVFRVMSSVAILLTAIPTPALAQNVLQPLDSSVRASHERGDTLQEFRTLDALLELDNNAWRKFGDLVGAKDAFTFVETHGVLRRRHGGDYGRMFDAEDVWYAMLLATRAHAWNRMMELYATFRKLDHTPPDITLLAELRTAAYARHDNPQLAALDASVSYTGEKGYSRDWYVDELRGRIGLPSDELYPLLKSFLASYPRDVYLRYGVFSVAVDLQDWSGLTTAGPALIAAAPGAADLGYYAVMYAAYTSLGRLQEAENITERVHSKFPKQRDRWQQYLTNVNEHSPDAALQQILAELKPPSEPH